MKRLLAFLLLFPCAALAQSSPNWPTGYRPTAAEWNAQWAGKTDYPLTMTINGVACTPLAPCTVTTPVSGLTIGTTVITGGTSGRFLYDNAGVVGEVASSGSGSVVLVNSPSLISPNLGVPSFLTLTNATGLPVSGLISGATTVNGQTCTLGASCTVTAAASGLVVGTTAITSGTTSRVLYDNGGVVGEYTTSGTGNVAMTTSPSFTTPALGTPSALVLTNATGTPAAITLTNAAGLPTSAITGTITSEKCVTWDSTLAVTAQVVDFPIEWTSFTLTSVKAKVAGGGSFTYAMQIGGVAVTSCNGVTVNSSSNVATTCTAANTGSANAIISMVIASPSGTVNQAYVCPVFTHTVN